MKNILIKLADNPKINQVNPSDGVPGESDVVGNINTIIGSVVAVLGTVAVVVIIIGGIQYMTSAGDAGKVKKAKDTILYGIIGLIIVILSYVIVNFVIGTFNKS